MRDIPPQSGVGSSGIELPLVIIIMHPLENRSPLLPQQEPEAEAEPTISSNYCRYDRESKKLVFLEERIRLPSSLSQHLNPELAKVEALKIIKEYPVEILTICNQPIGLAYLIEMLKEKPDNLKELDISRCSLLEVNDMEEFANTLELFQREIEKFKFKYTFSPVYKNKGLNTKKYIVGLTKIIEALPKLKVIEFYSACADINTLDVINRTEYQNLLIALYKCAELQPEEIHLVINRNPHTLGALQNAIFHMRKQQQLEQSSPDPKETYLETKFYSETDPEKKAALEQAIKALQKLDRNNIESTQSEAAEPNPEPVVIEGYNIARICRDMCSLFAPNQRS